MIILLIVAAMFVGLVFAVAAIVPKDGYGHRPAPRSHHDSFNRPNPFV